MIIWVLLLCVYETSSETLDNVEIYPTVSNVQATTEYSVSLVTRTLIPAGGKFLLIFPSDFQNLPQGTCSCTFSGSSLNNSGAICTMSGNTLTISNWFTTSFSPGLLSFTITNITNPKTNKETATFRIYTKDSSDNIIDSRETGLTLSLNAIRIVNASITTTSNITGDPNAWTFAIKTSLTIPESGKIVVTFPYWNAHLPGSSGYLKSFIQDPPLCTGIPSNVYLGTSDSITCTFDMSTNKLSLSITSDIPASNLSFKVQPIVNPPSTQQVSGFIISTFYEGGDIESTSSISLSVRPTIPNTLLFGDPSLEMSDTKVATLSVYTFYLYTTNPVYPTVNLEISFPEDFVLGVSSVVGYLWIRKDPTFDVSGRLLTLRNCFESYVDGNKAYYITITYIRNPMSLKTSGAISFTLRTSSGFLIDTSNAGITVTATLGSLRVVNLYGSNTVINAETSYVFEIIPEQSIMSGAVISVIVPDEMSVVTAGLSQVSGLDADAIPSVQKVGEKQFIITNAFPKLFGSATIKFSYSTLKNPPTTVQSSPFTIRFCEDSNCTYLISTHNTYRITATPDTLTSVSISQASRITGDTTLYTFSITTKNTIPISGTVFIQLPSEISIILSNSPSCSNPVGFSSTLSCQFTSNSITILNGFQSSSFSPGTLIISVSSIKNPPSTSPSSSFSITTYTGEYEIDKLTSGIIVTMDTPHEIESAYFESEIDVVTGATQEYILYITPFNYMPSGGFVNITPPIYYAFLSTVACEATGSVTLRASCSLIGDSLSITVTFQQARITSEFAIRLRNIRNPGSTQETESFTLVSRDGNFLIDSISEGLTLRASIPATMTSVSITLENSEISATGFYEFRFTIINSIPSGGSLEIAFPSQVSFLSGYQCFRGSTRVSCVFNAFKVLRIVGFTSEIKPAALTFRVTNLKNGSTAGTSGQFKLTTKNPTFSIDTSTDRVVTFTCRDPCATCSTTADTCTSCRLGSITPYFWGGVCNPSCQIGTYDDGTLTCKPCSAPCNSCIYTSNYCTSCDQSSEYKYLYNTQCVTQCPANYLISDNNICFICSENCRTCYNAPDNCTSCVAPLYLYSNTCIPHCNSDTQVLVDNICYDCDPTCKTCLGSPTSCTSCPDGYKLYYNTCISSCPENISVDMGTYCSSCTSNCATCNISSYRCESCNDGYLLLEGMCLLVCPDGYAMVEGRCEECEEYCEVCNAGKECSRCVEGRYLYGGMCYDRCPRDVSIQMGKECIPCLDKCKTCTMTVDNCTACNTGMYLYENVCYNVCPLNTVPIEGICKECTEGCKVCDQISGNCLKCEDGKALYQNECKNECGSGMIIFDGTCTECTGNCKECENIPEYCTSCNEGFVLFVGKCLESCPESYEDVNGVCDLVMNECATGCGNELLNNERCDPECNNEACSYDLGKCDPPDDDDIPNDDPYVVPKVSTNSYTDSINAEEDPLPVSAVGVIVGTGVFAAKLTLGGFEFLPSVISTWSILETASRWATLGLLADTDATHGRELSLSEDTQMKIAISLMSILLILHYLINIAFLLCYYFYTLKKDSLHRVWYNKHYRYMRTISVFSVIISYKLIRILNSEILHAKRCTAKFDKMSSLFKPMLYFTLIDMVFSAIPLIGLMGYCLWVYSTGNVVWLMVLDTLIITALVVVISTVDVYYMRKVIAREDIRQKFVKNPVSKVTGDETVLDEKMKNYMIKDLNTDRSIAEFKKYFSNFSDFTKTERSSPVYNEDHLNTVSDSGSNTITRRGTAQFKETPSSDPEMPLDLSFQICKPISDTQNAQESSSIHIQDINIQITDQSPIMSPSSDQAHDHSKIMDEFEVSESISKLTNKRM